MKNRLWSGIIILVLMGSCNLIKKSSAPADAYKGYQEDLSDSRITFETQPAPNVVDESRFEGGELAIDKDLDQALTRFANNNKAERYYSGFTVLVYSGVDRNLAFKTRNELYTNFPEIKFDLQYQQPRYLLKVGKFINRIEAQAYYFKLKDSFPSARIIQDRFQRDENFSSDENQNAEKQD
ncbi:hypothetical protein P872_05460 [Rhodonellum psychrophilum GCM71 = DSM 17998]|uniref:SPOR domain-containing protein n=2 Tax=Rhodonellum TaxID=336827 RepID=U5BZC4_9BACT|nr:MULTISPECIES: hypothetical protein [Rhodonellum]ERM82894.1 hypothetical protein P872_05460 [Rhodonellum psychrophilum GCM71 = DSM 17998]MDO9552521.1 hypothetical protein [Rhodonellum sp.]SDY47411.1 hypothetical protein SAMN05444412_101263 [Rhodonellum ikkaensis]